jgi:hypothetical protein
LSGGVEDGLDDEVEVGVVQAGDRVGEVDGGAVGEAGGQTQDASFAAGTGEAGVKCGEGGFPVDVCCRLVDDV